MFHSEEKGPGWVFLWGETNDYTPEIERLEPENDGFTEGIPFFWGTYFQISRLRFQGCVFRLFIGTTT